MWLVKKINAFLAASVGNYKETVSIQFLAFCAHRVPEQHYYKPVTKFTTEQICVSTVDFSSRRLPSLLTAVSINTGSNHSMITSTTAGCVHDSSSSFLVVCRQVFPALDASCIRKPGFRMVSPSLAAVSRVCGSGVRDVTPMLHRRRFAALGLSKAVEPRRCACESSMHTARITQERPMHSLL